jgi:hypothetical protein
MNTVFFIFSVIKGTNRTGEGKSANPVMTKIKKNATKKRSVYKTANDKG